MELTVQVRPRIASARTGKPSSVDHVSPGEHHATKRYVHQNAISSCTMVVTRLPNLDRHTIRCQRKERNKRDPFLVVEFASSFVSSPLRIIDVPRIHRFPFKVYVWILYNGAFLGSHKREIKGNFLAVARIPHPYQRVSNQILQRFLNPLHSRPSK